MKKATVIVSLLTVVGFAKADPFTSSLEIAKLTEMVKSLNEQLEYAQNTLDLQEQLAQMQQQEWVSTISEGGTQLWGLATEIEKTRNLYEGFESPSEQVQELKGDVEAYFQLYENASNEEDAIQALKKYSHALMRLDDQYWLGSESPNKDNLYHFSRMMEDLDRVSILRESQRSNLLDLADGVNSQEAAVIMATDTNTMTSILLDQQASELSKEANQALIDAQDELIYNALIGYGSEGDSNE